MNSSAAVPRASPRGRDPASRAPLFSGLVEHRARILAGIAGLAIVVGGLLYLGGNAAAGDNVWRAAVALLAAELAFEVARTVIVEHHMGVDTIALVAMLGSLALGQELAGVIVGLMFSGGATLEDLAFDEGEARTDRAGTTRAEGRAAADRRADRAGASRARAGR